MNTKRCGIILLNLGSPDSTGVKDLRRYLMEFLMDKRVIDYPYLFRKLLVGGIIVPFRASKSAEAYKKIWTNNGSPLVAITRQFRDLLQQQIEGPVEIAMRYGNPSVATAYNHLIAKVKGIEEVIAIPMYPHYAMSSYETAVEQAKEIHKKARHGFNLTIIKPYYNNADYIAALSKHIEPYLQQPYDHILFSYHGIPERHLKKTDITGHHCLRAANCCETDSPAHAKCYRHQCLTTTDLVTKQLKIPADKFSYSFQSRLGREEWLKPYTDFRLLDMPKEGIKKLVVVCPAFVSDCLETLEEIAMRGKESFLSAGGETFTMIPCLNDDRLWVNAVAGWIKKYIAGDQSMILHG